MHCNQHKAQLAEDECDKKASTHHNAVLQGTQSKTGEMNDGNEHENQTKYINEMKYTQFDSLFSHAICLSIKFAHRKQLIAFKCMLLYKYSVLT